MNESFWERQLVIGLYQFNIDGLVFCIFSKYLFDRTPKLDLTIIDYFVSVLTTYNRWFNIGITSEAYSTSSAFYKLQSL